MDTNFSLNFSLIHHNVLVYQRKQERNLVVDINQVIQVILNIFDHHQELS